MGTARQLTARERAFAEMARARGWVEDAALDRLLEDAKAGDSVAGLDAALRDGGALTAEQVASLWEAIDGPADGGSGSYGATLRPSGSDATFRPQSAGSSSPTIRPSGSDLTLRAPSSTGASSSNDATIKAPSVAPGRSSGIRPPSLSSSSASTPGGRFGPYKLVSELGRGGMGVVWRALHADLGREVALKVLKSADADDVSLERFKREASLVAKIGRHAHLVQVHDVGREGERLYFTMDYIEGKSLRQLIDADGALPPREAARITAEIAGALEAAHRVGVVHRDVKPHNVLLDKTGKSFLTDFGLAKDRTGASGVTASGEIFGTPAYMSPEQASGRGKDAGASADVYSLGATLFEMLAGRAPFEGPTPIDVLRAVVGTDPVSPGSIRDGIHPDLEIVCLKAMRKEPERRYTTAGELEADLRRWLNGEPIHARPAGWLERTLAKARRRKAAVAAVGLGVLLSIGVATAGTVRWVRRDREQKQQDLQRKQNIAAATPLFQEGQSLIRIADDALRGRQEGESRRLAAQAAGSLSRAAALVPDDAEMQYELGRARKRAGDTDGAAVAFEQATILRPNHALAWFEHGQLQLERLFSLAGGFSREIARARTFKMESADVNERLVKAGRAEGGKDDPVARATAARDFKQVIDSKAAGDLADYGSGVLLYLDGKLGEARLKLNACLDANKYFVPALRARAEINELEGRVVEAIADRQAIYNLEPTSDHGWDLAWVQTDRTRKDETTKLVADLLKDDESDDHLQAAAEILEVAGNPTISIKYCQKLLDRAVPANRTQRLYNLLAMQIGCGKVKEAKASLELERGKHDDMAWPVMEAYVAGWTQGILANSKLLRKIPKDSPWRPVVSEMGANVEWLLGNLDLAMEWAELRAQNKTWLDAQLWRAQIRMDLDDVTGALDDLEAIRKRAPNLNANLIYLAGARLRNHDASGAYEALKEAVECSGLNAQARQAGMGFVKTMEPKVRAAKTVEDEIALLETLAAAIALVAPQAPGNTGTREAAAGAQRGLSYSIQQIAYAAGLWERSFAAGEAFNRDYHTPCVMYRQAGARARQGRDADAIKLLEECVKLGFDDGGRMDREAAFETLRKNPEFVALRKRCR